MKPRLRLERGRLWTQSLDPGQKIYGELVRNFEGKEYRCWNSRRSKLAAYQQQARTRLKVKGDERVLYLGAASGTTVSHLSDLLPEGTVFAIEVSPRPFRDLLAVAARRPNIVPVLADVREPQRYAAYVGGPVDVVVQDVAQRDQAELLEANLQRFARPGTRVFLAVKSRSVDVAAEPRDVYARVRKHLEAAGRRVSSTVDLAPLQRDHAMIVATTS